MPIGPIVLEYIGLCFYWIIYHVFAAVKPLDEGLKLDILKVFFRFFENGMFYGFDGSNDL